MKRSSASQSTTGIKNQNIDAKLAWQINPNHNWQLFGTYGKQVMTSLSFAPGENIPPQTANGENGKNKELWLGDSDSKDTTVTKRLGLSWDGEYDWGSSHLNIYRNGFEKRGVMTEVNNVFAPSTQKTLKQW